MTVSDQDIVSTPEPVRRMARCVTNVLLKNWCGPVFIFQLEIVPVISVMHIRRDQSAFIGCRRLQRYTGETVLYFLSNDPLAKLSGACDRGEGRLYALQHAGPGRLQMPARSHPEYRVKSL
jgi:hypothetical protein